MGLYGNNLFSESKNTEIICEALKKTHIRNIVFESNNLEGNDKNIDLFYDLGTFLVNENKKLVIELGKKINVKN